MNPMTYKFCSSQILTNPPLTGADKNGFSLNQDANFFPLTSLSLYSFVRYAGDMIEEANELS